MRKRTWLEIGIAALGLLLVCASVEVVAQAQRPGQEPAPGAVTQQQALGSEAEQWQAISQLNAQVLALQRQVELLEARLEAVGAASPGVGGAGTAGIEGELPAEPGTSMVDVIFSGSVRSVSQQQLVLVDEGGDALTIPLARDVRVFRDGRGVALRTLEEGAQVRAVADMLIPGNPVTEIVVLPSPEEQGQQ